MHRSAFGLAWKTFHLSTILFTISGHARISHAALEKKEKRKKEAFLLPCFSSSFFETQNRNTLGEHGLQFAVEQPVLVSGLTTLSRLRDEANPTLSS